MLNLVFISILFSKHILIWGMEDMKGVILKKQWADSRKHSLLTSVTVSQALHTLHITFAPSLSS